MTFRAKNAELDDLLNSDFSDMSKIARELKKLEQSPDQEVFEISHTFANVAAPIRGNIGLGSNIEKVLEVCDHAKQRLEDFEMSVDRRPVQTVHSESFFNARRQYLDILLSVRRKIVENQHLLIKPRP